MQARHEAVQGHNSQQTGGQVGRQSGGLPASQALLKGLHAFATRPQGHV